MRLALAEIGLRLVVAGALVAVAGYTAGAEVDRPATCQAEPLCIPIAKYNTHMAAIELEVLHRLQINDIAGLRGHIERTIASNVLSLWGSIQDEHASAENRKAAYGVLRLIAIQNEKFPVAAVNDDPTVTAILRSAIEEDTAKAELLRRQDWSKPKWVNWVD